MSIRTLNKVLTGDDGQLTKTGIPRALDVLSTLLFKAGLPINSATITNREE
jgi:hypothetical protein